MTHEQPRHAYQENASLTDVKMFARLVRGQVSQEEDTTRVLSNAVELAGVPLHKLDITNVPDRRGRGVGNAWGVHLEVHGLYRTLSDD